MEDAGIIELLFARSEQGIRELDAKRGGRYAAAMEEIEACMAAPGTVETEVEAGELARGIESFLDTLSAENRVIFVCRYWFADSCRDIAVLTGLTEKNVSVRLTRLRRQLKHYLTERGMLG